MSIRLQREHDEDVGLGLRSTRVLRSDRAAVAVQLIRVVNEPAMAERGLARRAQLCRRAADN